ncbi:MAG: alpha/beta fold hydrolase [Gemmatimonadales bacterium]
MTATPKPIVLIHGLWMTPSSWSGFKGYFESRGHRVLTPGWPGLEGGVADVRRDPSLLAGVGHKEIADHYEKIIRSLDEAPIIMGHSMGGLTTQILLDRGLGAAGVAIDAAPPKEVLLLPISALKSSAPVLANPFNYGRVRALTFRVPLRLRQRGARERRARALRPRGDPGAGASLVPGGVRQREARPGTRGSTSPIRAARRCC